MKEIRFTADQRETSTIAVLLAFAAIFFLLLHWLQMNVQVGWLQQMTAKLDAQNAEIKASGEAMRLRLGAVFGEVTAISSPLASEKKASPSLEWLVQKEPKMVILIPVQDTGSPQNLTVNGMPLPNDFIPLYQADLQLIQSKLKTEGLFQGETEGFFDKQTKMALSRYQQKYNLKNQTGDLDTVTLLTLGLSRMVNRAMIQ